MKRILRCLFLLSLTASLLTSCVRDVVLDAGEKPTVVVECVLNNSDTQELRLNFTKGASKTEADSLTEAVATLIDLTESQTVGQFNRQKGDLWTLDYSAVPEHKYRLEVLVPGYELIWAEDTMPRKTDILGHYFNDTFYRDRQPSERYAGIPEKYAYYFEGNYYTFGREFSSPLWIYGIDIDLDDRFTRKGPIASKIFTDLPSVDNFNISKKYYLPELAYYYDYTEAANVKIAGSELIYPDLKGSVIHNSFLRINGGRADEPFLLCCNFQQWYYTPQLKLFGYRPMIFMFVSNIYDSYLKSGLQIIEIKELSDLSAIYLRDNIPSNIHGGIGVFGCKIELDLNCDVKPTRIPIEEYSKYGINKGTHKYIND